MYLKLAKESLVYGASDLVTKLISFFTFPLIAVAISPESFGYLELIFTTIGLVGLIINCGLNNAIQRFYWDADSSRLDQKLIVSSGLSMQFIFGLLVSTVIFLFSKIILSPDYFKDFPFTFLSVISALVLMSFQQWHQYILDVTRLQFSPWKFFSISIFSRVMTALFALYAVLVLKRGIDGIISAQALVLLITFPLSLFLIRKDLVFQINRTWIKKIVKLGYPFIFGGMAYWLFGSIDRWMLARLSSIEEVGIYSVSFRFVSLVLFVSTAFGQAWSPVAIKIKRDYPNTYREFYANVLLILFFIMLFFGGGISLFSGEIISTIMSDDYKGSSIPLSFLSFGIIYQSTQQITAIGISLEKKTVLLAKIAWITAIINFILNLILIPMSGAVGASIATMFSFLIHTLFLVFFTQKLHQLPFDWVRIGIFFLISILVLYLSLSYNSYALETYTVAIKLVIAVSLCCIGLIILPLKKLRNNE